MPTVEIMKEFYSSFEESLAAFRSSRSKVTIDEFSNDVINKDQMGCERLEVYSTNSFLQWAFTVYKGEVEGEQLRGLLNVLLGYEFNVILYKQFKSIGATNFQIEERLNVDKHETYTDISCDFSKTTIVPQFFLLHPDSIESEVILPEGRLAFEAKAGFKVVSADITRQLKLYMGSKKYTKSYGVILKDTSRSAEVVNAINRMGASLIVAANITKCDVINSMQNIYIK